MEELEGGKFTSNNKSISKWGLHTRRKGPTMDSNQEMRYFCILKPVMPIRDSILYRRPVVVGSGIGLTVRSYMLNKGSQRRLYVSTIRSYVSSMKNTIKITTISEYMDPMPYVHRHDVRATKKPNANGERNGAMRKPMVQILSYWCSKVESNHNQRYWLPS